jgi:predicted TIM-barrel fold metal-dependent hydrolase
MRWLLDEAAPWVETAIETFGTPRCMFGSHMPISTLSYGVAELYGRYAKIVSGLSAHESDELFYGVADRWFRPR